MSNVLSMSEAARKQADLALWRAVDTMKVAGMSKFQIAMMFMGYGVAHLDGATVEELKIKASESAKLAVTMINALAIEMQQGGPSA